MAGTRVTSALILIFFTASALPSSILPQGNPVEEFHKMCERTTHPNLCINTFDWDTRNDLKANFTGFSTILKDKAADFAAAVLFKIDNLTTNLAPGELDALDSCYEDYGDVLDILIGNNFTVFNNQTYATLYLRLAQTYDLATTCEATFKPPLISPLTTENLNYMDMVETVAEILNIHQCDRIYACDV